MILVQLVGIHSAIDESSTIVNSSVLNNASLTNNISVIDICNATDNRDAKDNSSVLYEHEPGYAYELYRQFDRARCAKIRIQMNLFFGFDLIVFLFALHSLSGAENRTRDGWVGSVNASSVLCRPP